MNSRGYKLCLFIEEKIFGEMGIICRKLGELNIISMRYTSRISIVIKSQYYDSMYILVECRIQKTRLNVDEVIIYRYLSKRFTMKHHLILLS